MALAPCAASASATAVANLMLVKRFMVFSLSKKLVAVSPALQAEGPFGQAADRVVPAERVLALAVAARRPVAVERVRRDAVLRDAVLRDAVGLDAGLCAVCREPECECRCEPEAGEVFHSCSPLVGWSVLLDRMPIPRQVLCQERMSL